ncbi:MAG: methionyl-tRNA formyltransferase [Planctomycetota bacterium]
MRIVMFGTGPFAVPTFQSLLDSNHEVVALFTRPIADAGKRRKTAENPTRDVAESIGLPIFDPVNVNDDESVQQLESFQSDLFVVCDYGQILSRDCLAAARLGGINLHGSLLPKYRGAAPIHWAIYHGEPTTGITIIHMTAKLDGGPCLVAVETEIQPDETTETIEPRLAQLGVEPVNQAIQMLEAWDGSSEIGIRQDQALATKAPRLKKSDGLIDWNRSATQIVNQIRAFQPWPGTYSNWHAPNKKQPVRLIIHQAAVANTDDLDARDTQPGHVLSVDKNRLVIATGDGGLELLIIQPAGKKPMPIADFLRGNPPQVDDRFA